MLEDEIIINRSVVVMGNPLSPPIIYPKAGDSLRAFRVVAGGFLDLRFVRLRQGAAVARGRFGVELPPEPEEDDDPDGTGEEGKEAVDLTNKHMIYEVRGACVLFDVGALGGTFQGVVFTSLENSAQDMKDAILAMRTRVGIRVYGGMLFMIAGNVQLLNCHFFETGLKEPFTDTLIIGGDI